VTAGGHAGKPAQQRRFRISIKGASVSLFIDARLNQGGAPETFGELNRHGLRSLFETFDASCAILSAQYDGLDMEDQLTCGIWSFHDTVTKFQQGAANHFGRRKCIEMRPAFLSILPKVS
jgi:hypothetical protein